MQELAHKLPRLVIAGTQSGVGKTTITLGLMAAICRCGMKIAPYKVGPDYIDPGFHSYVTKVKSRNLDLWLLNEDKIAYLFYKNSIDADISIVEGVMGLYDGRGTNHEASTAHLAKVLKAPVVLVIDGSGISASAAAQVLGYKLYDKEVNLAGVIINRVSGEVHYKLLKEAIERDTGIRCFGYLKKTDQIHLKSRHLGLVPGIEVDKLQSQVEQLTEMVEESVDIDGLIELSKNAIPFDLESKISLTCSNEISKLKAKLNLDHPVRIGLAYDEAFHFYYQDGLDLLKELGAELVEFSPLHDVKLPDNLDGLYIGGGYPEVFANQLEENQSLRNSIKNAINKGLPTYAECGGLMYLTQEIKTAEDDTYQMVGVIPTMSMMTSKLQRFGYVEVELGQNLFDLSREIIPAHEFHYSKIQDDDELNYSYNINRRKKNWECGVTMKNLLAGYPHLHFYSNPRLAYGFIKKCVKYRNESVR
ncbi:MAG: cobyrinate a,c-diamide synthase [Halanaerobiales bacterium]|nr:cobyrinate a,c-diamide synthase [Halanaerobiales bacterium]